MAPGLEHVPDPPAPAPRLRRRERITDPRPRDERPRPLDLVSGTSASLSVLDAHGPNSQQALAKHIAGSPTMITQMVDEVEARGLAERRPNPADRRSYLVTLTPEGKRKLAAARRVAAAFAAELAAPIGEEGDRELRARCSSSWGATRCPSGRSVAARHGAAVLGRRTWRIASTVSVTVSAMPSPSARPFHGLLLERLAADVAHERRVRPHESAAIASKKENVRSR